MPICICKTTYFLKYFVHRGVYIVSACIKQFVRLCYRV